MTNQNDDGIHLKGLIINFIHFYWPNLLKHEFIYQFLDTYYTYYQSIKKYAGKIFQFSK
jgi:DNA gyrase/topoisomerase IV subunit B